MQPVMVFKKDAVYEKGALEKGQADMQAEIQEQRSLSVGDFPEHFYHSVQCRRLKRGFSDQSGRSVSCICRSKCDKISDFGTATTPVKRDYPLKWKYLLEGSRTFLAVVYERYGKNGNVAKALVEGTFKEPSSSYYLVP